MLGIRSGLWWGQAELQILRMLHARYLLHPPCPLFDFTSPTTTDHVNPIPRALEAFSTEWSAITLTPVIDACWQSQVLQHPGTSGG